MSRSRPPNVNPSNPLTRLATNSNEFTIDTHDLARCCPLDIGRHAKKVAKASLGDLDKLPCELLTIILLDLFRRVNQSARLLVNSVPQYRVIATRAPASLRALLSTGMARWVSILKLYHTLRSCECAYCGDFGGMLNLLTCKRVCFNCYAQDPRLQPIVKRQAKMRYHLGEKVISTLPAVQIIPGTYSAFGQRYRLRITLFDPERVRQAAIEHHGSKFKNPPYSPGSKTGCSDSYRYMTLVGIPWIGAEPQAEEWSLICRTCYEREFFDRNDYRLNWRRLFSNEGFEEHLKECKLERKMSRAYSNPIA